VTEVRNNSSISIRRLGRTFDEPSSTLGRWLKKPSECPESFSRRFCPVSGDPVLRSRVRALCEEDRHLTWGHRRIRALLLRRFGMRINRKTVLRIMREEGLTRPKVWRRPYRPRRVEKMKPTDVNEAWQVDMTSFTLSDFTTLYLVMVIDCFSRKIEGWTLSRRCRASEWVSAVRMGLETEGLSTKEACSGLLLRSDNGSQPCSKKFVEFLSSRGLKGQYTGYDAPDDNAYVERVIRTIKEEEIWLNSYDSFWEAHKAIEEYINYYNNERIHSSIGYMTPIEYEAENVKLLAA